MPQSRQKVKVRIMDRDYTLRAGDDPSALRVVAKYVDGRMREISKAAAKLPKSDVAVLAALNIADELHKARAGEGKAASTSTGKSSPATVKDLRIVGKRIQEILKKLPK